MFFEEPKMVLLVWKMSLLVEKNQGIFRSFVFLFNIKNRKIRKRLLFLFFNFSKKRKKNYAWFPVFMLLARTLINDLNIPSLHVGGNKTLLSADWSTKH